MLDGGQRVLDSGQWTVGGDGERWSAGGRKWSYLCDCYEMKECAPAMYNHSNELRHQNYGKQGQEHKRERLYKQTYY